MPGTYLSDQDEACVQIGVSNEFSPLNGTSGVAVSHTFDISAGSKDSDIDTSAVRVFYDDGGSNTGNVTASESSGTYTAAITYPAAGTYVITVEVAFSSASGLPTELVRLDDPVNIVAP